MNPSYARIRLPLAQAMARFSQWLNLAELEPPKKLEWRHVIDAACENGNWRSVVAVYIYESQGWAVFDDLTGHLASFSADQWRGLADNDELIFAGYNDSIPYGQLIVIRSGQVLREFLDNQQDPKQNINFGALDFEQKFPINNWITLAQFVDDDEVAALPEIGLLWMFGKRP